jgi:hypothetical protein
VCVGVVCPLNFRIAELTRGGLSLGTPDLGCILHTE